MVATRRQLRSQQVLLWQQQGGERQEDAVAAVLAVVASTPAAAAAVARSAVDSRQSRLRGTREKVLRFDLKVQHVTQLKKLLQ